MKKNGDIKMGIWNVRNSKEKEGKLAEEMIQQTIEMVEVTETIKRKCLQGNI